MRIQINCSGAPLGGAVAPKPSITIPKQMWTKRKHRRDTQERGSWRNASNVGDGFEGTEQIKKNKVERGAGQRTGVKKYIWDNSTWVVYWGELQFVGQLHGSRCGVDHVDQHWATGKKGKETKMKSCCRLCEQSCCSTAWPADLSQLYNYTIYIYIYTPQGHFQQHSAARCFWVHIHLDTHTHKVRSADWWTVQTGYLVTASNR